MTRDGTRGFGTSSLSDEVIVIDLTTTPVTSLGSIHFDQVAGVGKNQPDALGGGEPIGADLLPVGLRAAGNLAILNVRNLELRTLVNLEPAAPFNPMTCGPVGPPTGAGGCAVHGVTPRRATAAPWRGRTTKGRTTGSGSIFVRNLCGVREAAGEEDRNAPYVAGGGQTAVRACNAGPGPGIQ